MRGADSFTESLLAMRTLEDLVSSRHQMRGLRKTANEALEKLAPILDEERKFRQRTQLLLTELP